jgi:hypothetical protein
MDGARTRIRGFVVVAAVAVLLLLLFLALLPAPSGPGHPSTLTPTNGQQKGTPHFAVFGKRRLVPPSAPSRRHNLNSAPDFSFMSQKRLVPSGPNPLHN